ncbi:hypothetical protein PM082_016770 [Marasmius tenuissimus]|nr:hypothetical protein PM082_016770 [Marasmius tenuissimus]
MSMFHSARRTKIIGGNFSIVQGNQTNNSYSHLRSSERSLARIQPGEEWKEMLYEEYERISLGKIKILETLCHQPVVAPRKRHIGANLWNEDNLEAERVVEIASIVDGKEESLPLLAVRYAGRDAKKLFKKDCMNFALQRSSTMPQFRAFNDSNISMIVFNEELVSASHFLSHNLYSFHAQCYLHLQARSGALLRGSTDLHRAWVSSMSSPLGLNYILWFRPQTGVLCFGPPGPHRRLVLKSHEWSSHGFQWPCGPDVQDWPIKTEQGEVRFLVTETPNSPGFPFQQSQCRTHEEEWLAQAGSIFGRFRIPRDKWSSSVMIQAFVLQLSSDAKKSLETENDDWNEDLGSPCYLFLPPPPQLPNGAPDIETWLRGECLYYYSYDPEGGSAITEQDRITLGLPSYTSEIYVEYVYWKADAYDFMEQWQKAKGFDYSTADYAESLGFTILEGIPKDELRFEDLVPGAHSEGVLADDLMDVDSDIGNTSNHYDSSSEVDMDVDG